MSSEMSADERRRSVHLRKPIPPCRVCGAEWAISTDGGITSWCWNCVPVKPGAPM